MNNETMNNGALLNETMDNETLGNETLGNETLGIGEIELAQGLLEAWAEQGETPAESSADNRLEVVVRPEHLVAAVASLQQAQWGYLAAITGMDHGPEAG